MARFRDPSGNVMGFNQQRGFAEMQVDRRRSDNKITLTSGDVAALQASLESL